MSQHHRSVNFLPNTLSIFRVWNHLEPPLDTASACIMISESYLYTNLSPARRCCCCRNTTTKTSTTINNRPLVDTRSPSSSSRSNPYSSPTIDPSFSSDIFASSSVRKRNWDLDLNLDDQEQEEKIIERPSLSSMSTSTTSMPELILSDSEGRFEDKDYCHHEHPVGRREVESLERGGGGEGLRGGNSDWRSGTSSSTVIGDPCAFCARPRYSSFTSTSSSASSSASSSLPPLSSMSPLSSATTTATATAGTATATKASTTALLITLLSTFPSPAFSYPSHSSSSSSAEAQNDNHNESDDLSNHNDVIFLPTIGKEISQTTKTSVLDLESESESLVPVAITVPQQHHQEEEELDERSRRGMEVVSSFFSSLRADSVIGEGDDRELQEEEEMLLFEKRQGPTDGDGSGSGGGAETGGGGGADDGSGSGTGATGGAGGGGGSTGGGGGGADPTETGDGPTSGDDSTNGPTSGDSPTSTPTAGPTTSPTSRPNDPTTTSDGTTSDNDPTTTSDRTTSGNDSTTRTSDGDSTSDSRTATTTSSSDDTSRTSRTDDSSTRSGRTSSATRSEDNEPTRTFTRTTQTVIPTVVSTSSAFVVTSAGQQQTVTSVIAVTRSTTVQTVNVATGTNPASLNGGQDSNKSSFFHNTGAVAGVFVVVGLAIAAILLGLAFIYVRRKKRRDLDEDLRVAAGGAGPGGAGANRLGVDDDENDDPFADETALAAAHSTGHRTHSSSGGGSYGGSSAVATTAPLMAQYYHPNTSQGILSAASGYYPSGINGMGSMGAPISSTGGTVEGGAGGMVANGTGSNGHGRTISQSSVHAPLAGMYGAYGYGPTNEVGSVGGYPSGMGGRESGSYYRDSYSTGVPYPNMAAAPDQNGGPHTQPYATSQPMDWDPNWAEYVASGITTDYNNNPADNQQGEQERNHHSAGQSSGSASGSGHGNGERSGGAVGQSSEGAPLDSGYYGTDPSSSSKDEKSGRPASSSSKSNNQQQEDEEDEDGEAAGAGTNNNTAAGPPVPVDQRLDPKSLLMRNYPSNVSLRDNEDYSRKILRIANPSAE